METNPANAPSSSPFAVPEEPKKKKPGLGFLKWVVLIVVLALVAAFVSRNVKFVAGFPIFKKNKAAVDKQGVESGAPPGQAGFFGSGRKTRK